MKRSSPMKPGKPLQRRSQLRATAPAKASVPVFRPRCCKVKLGGCGQTFYPRLKDQKACGVECAASMGAVAVVKENERQRRAAAKAATEEKRQDRAKRESLKRLNELRAEAQDAFRWYIRERDRAAGHGCICCGEPLDWDSTMPGGAVDAGHYMSRGSTPELAFDERNTNAQRKGCNRPGGTTRAKFKAGMVARWGQAIVDELEGPQVPPRYRHDDYRAMRDDYNARARALKKARR